MVYLPSFTINQPNVGKFTIYGWYGYFVHPLLVEGHPSFTLSIMIEIGTCVLFPFFNPSPIGSMYI